VLERPCELIVEPLDERHCAAGDLEDFALGNGRWLVVVLPLFGALDNDNVFCALERVEQLDELLLRARRMLVMAFWQ
jgi:hypothetical protein